MTFGGDSIWRRLRVALGGSATVLFCHLELFFQSVLFMLSVGYGYIVLNVGIISLTTNARMVEKRLCEKRCIMK